MFKKVSRVLEEEIAPNSDKNSNSDYLSNAVNNENDKEKIDKSEIIIANKTEEKPLMATGNGLAGLALIFFTISMVYFMIYFLRDIFVSTQLVREPLFLGKIDS